MPYRALAALIIGGAFVFALAQLLLRLLMFPIPILLLFPGLVVGALLPGSGFNPEGTMDWWSTPYGFISYGVNVVFYSGLAFLLLPRLIRRLSKKPTAEDL